MDLTINFVWIGPRGLGWLEKFMVYSWRNWECTVNLFTHRTGSDSPHDSESLGLPDDFCNIYDLPELLADDEQAVGADTRAVLTTWYEKDLPGWNEGGKERVYNMVDLSKSYIGMSRVGIVIDIKVAPSPHIEKYVDSKVFANNFITYKRAKVVENQCMGSMMPLEQDNDRERYGKGFESALFTKSAAHGTLNPLTMKDTIDKAWFPVATDAHKKACGSKTKFATTGDLHGLRGKWFDIGPYGKNRHKLELLIADADFKGIDGDDYGPFRIFKREWDQTNKQHNPSPTTDEHRDEMFVVAMKEFMKTGKTSGLPPDLKAKLLTPKISNAMGFRRF
ncbi:hypothetical protein G6O69_35405 [Pseudenhygromyxa sp. WMMC2535]|uniref:hypothetical protein n=1 Tax=Pseudenhygromyxa sp. WMMC2535 TaxID=2712867 RepID=UPI001554161D|nr:hypothetical protein [Pseudenhygromyxa sp. WMMC2535]NVB43165.1 hypothetical protein [Pseudenhygromyxa sp. WMMC2535]